MRRIRRIERIKRIKSSAAFWKIRSDLRQSALSAFYHSLAAVIMGGFEHAGWICCTF
jgi:hypothetical protein